MSGTKGATEILNQFLDEQKQIRDHVYLSMRKLAVRAEDTGRLHEVLCKNGLATSSHYGFYTGWNEVLDPGRLKALWQQIEPVEPMLRACQREWVNTRKRAMPPGFGESLPDQDLELAARNEGLYCAFVDCFEESNQPLLNKDLRNAMKVVREAHSVEAESIPKGDFDRVADTAFSVVVYNRTEEIEWAMNLFAEIRHILDSTHEDSMTNSLRQGFILLVTIFDASVFDLIRCGLTKDFFGQIGRFANPDDKIKIKKIGDAASLEAFKVQVIEDQLRNVHLGGLLPKLNDLGVQLVDKSSGLCIGHLIEVVQRRNAHIHNRGFLDKRYFAEKNSCRIYGYHEGQYAQIDMAYWKESNLMVEYCLRAIAFWVEGLPDS